MEGLGFNMRSLFAASLFAFIALSGSSFAKPLKDPISAEACKGIDAFQAYNSPTSKTAFDFNCSSTGKGSMVDPNESKEQREIRETAEFNDPTNRQISIQKIFDAKLIANASRPGGLDKVVRLVDEASSQKKLSINAKMKSPQLVEITRVETDLGTNKSETTVHTVPAQILLRIYEKREYCGRDADMNPAHKIEMDNSKVPYLVLAKGKVIPVPPAELGGNQNPAYGDYFTYCFDQPDNPDTYPTKGSSRDETKALKAGKKAAEEAWATWQSGSTAIGGCDGALKAFWTDAKAKYEASCSEYIVAKRLTTETKNPGPQILPKPDTVNSTVGTKGTPGTGTSGTGNQGKGTGSQGNPGTGATSTSAGKKD